MIARAILFLLALGLPGAVVALCLQKTLAPLFETRRRKRIGVRNAAESCDLCSGQVDPISDHFDLRAKRWRHARCVRQLLS